MKKVFIVLMSGLMLFSGCRKNDEKMPSAENKAEVMQSDITSVSVIEDKGTDEENEEKLSFSKEEIEQAIQMAEAYIEACNNQDEEKIMSTMSKEKVEEVLAMRENGTVAELYEASNIIEVISIGYNEEASQKAPVNYSNDPEELKEKIMILDCPVNFIVREGYSADEGWGEGNRPGFTIVMVRENENEPFYVYDTGF